MVDTNSGTNALPLSNGIRPKAKSADVEINFAVASGGPLKQCLARGGLDLHSKTLNSIADESVHNLQGSSHERAF